MPNFAKAPQTMAAHDEIDITQHLDLARIRDIKREDFTKLIRAIEKKSPPPLSPNQLISLLGELFGNEVGFTYPLVKQLFALAGPEQLKAGPPEAALREALSEIQCSDHSWSEEEMNRWKSIETEFLTLLNLPQIKRLGKALSLSYDYAHIIQEARILADIRPIFDEEASNIEGSVVSFTLRLNFNGLGGPKGISIAMNNGDVINLLLECERALAKAKKMAELMIEKAGIPTIITGEDEPNSERDDNG